MAIGTCFEHNKTSINQWLKSYKEGLFHCKDRESIQNTGWVMWENESGLSEEVKKIYEAVTVIADSEKFDNDKYFVRLKEVPVFGGENRNYSNVIISQELNSLPVIILTPDQNGVAELFLISNKHKVTGSLEDVKNYLCNEFKL